MILNKIVALQVTQLFRVTAAQNSHNKHVKILQKFVALNVDQLPVAIDGKIATSGVLKQSQWLTADRKFHGDEPFQMSLTRSRNRLARSGALS
jgi:hypothetical protein